ncbi:hypothetical protein LL266_16515 [Vibrio anguillarum]|uniref:hypothetical protein n=2 Tax=Vibrio TaxID=662 RepID=UPI0016A0839B|nr:hypothetical protein [Vibrio anguillarum]MCC4238096.1 hypothetical protein [Vibrio anguillarum]NOI07035.1 hypothetical protein [Vibrio anguillarum]
MQVNKIALMFENLARESEVANNSFQVKQIRPASSVRERFNVPATRTNGSPKQVDIGVKLNPEDQGKKIAFMRELNEKLQGGPVLPKKNEQKKPVIEDDIKQNTSSCSEYSTTQKIVVNDGGIHIPPPPPPPPPSSISSPKRVWAKIDGNVLDKENKDAANNFKLKASTYVANHAKVTGSSDMMTELKAKVLARKVD